MTLVQLSKHTSASRVLGFMEALRLRMTLAPAEKAHSDAVLVAGTAR